MQADPHVLAIADRARSAGIKMGDVLRAAGVAHSTWTRWTGGHFSPRLQTLRKIEAALDQAATDRAA